uniref:(northern house mosquito) hypothetical protein n=1 Tax=Culex pipiens TaxID=7175 RepID=A0A8D7ZWE7_CULPI
MAASTSGTLRSSCRPIGPIRASRTTKPELRLAESASMSPSKRTPRQNPRFGRNSTPVVGSPAIRSTSIPISWEGIRSVVSLCVSGLNIGMEFLTKSVLRKTQFIHVATSTMITNLS